MRMRRRWLGDSVANVVRNGMANSRSNNLRGGFSDGAHDGPSDAVIDVCPGGISNDDSNGGIDVGTSE